jgi:hypothetical protein
MVDAPKEPADLAGRLRFFGRVSHQEALREIAGADLPIKFDDRERSSSFLLSAKLFEYLAIGRPLVVVNPTRPDSQFLRHLPWCSTLYDPPAERIADAIEGAIRSSKKAPAEWLTKFHQQYDRRNQAHQLADWLDQLVPMTADFDEVPWEETEAFTVPQLALTA